MIPLFQNSLEARNFGAKASPLQIEELFRSRHSALTKCMSIGGNENLERFTKAAMHAQYCNEAMEEYTRYLRLPSMQGSQEIQIIEKKITIRERPLCLMNSNPK